ncbi:glycoside hydrolase [Candidatus Minimicrobia vallesae]|uniref:Glycoside hydrolase n=1 Tax=Candidatus Minimicrobia vallesae TaxID=2841264 RepID=A0A8F1MAV9_9BACT|nr:sialidase family protein [Candidatus Minimicrobia vallesae]QWQ31233.1 glycoside hydrolase [Candidatus Minimicrobia vallesae]
MSSRKKRKIYGGISIFFAVSVVSLAAMFAPFAKAEAAYSWKDITIPGGKVKESRISSDGSKLIVLQEGATFNDRKLLVSTDGGANWSSSAAPEGAINLLTNTDGSKLVVQGKYGQNNIHVSTDGGNSWTTPAAPVESDASLRMSPDGSTLTKCRYGGPLYVSRDNGQTWEQKGNECPSAVFNGGRMMLTTYGDLKQSTDYGATWEIVKDGAHFGAAFSANGASIFDGKKVSVDGGTNWSSISPIPGHEVSSNDVSRIGISNDGKRLFVTLEPDSYYPSWAPVASSVDGGKTWQQWGSEKFEGGSISMTADGSKIFATANNNIYRLGTLQLTQTKTFDVSTKSAPANTDNAVAKSTIAAKSLRCYDIVASSVKSLSADGITPTEARIKILGGLSFNINCTQASASSDITVSLASQYDVSKVRVYKKDSATANLQDITSQAVIKNETIAGKTVTTVSYKVVDGANNDDDHTANSVITDPVYFGVVNDPASPATPAGAASNPAGITPKGGKSGGLANTGASVWAIGGLAIVVIAGGIVLKRYI